MTEAPKNHADRGHSVWSASSTTRNVVCAGAIAMQTLAGPEKESEHAARGTACHEVSEKCLRAVKGSPESEPGFYLGSTVKTKEHEIEIDEEIVEGAGEYVDYVIQRGSTKGVQVWIEQHFSLAALDPPLEAGGTGDAVIYDPAAKELEIIDLKFGRGVVDVTGNPQLRTYGIGALLAFHDLDVETVKVTIVQPRAPVKGETIRSESFHVSDLIDWTNDLLAAMKRSKQALDEFEAINGSRTLFDEWAAAWLKPGACRFCKAEGICPALKKKALSVTPEAVQAWFEDPNAVEQPAVKNMPELASPEERGHILDGLEMLEDWIKGVRASEHTRAERGDPATDWYLADKIGNRIFIETDELKLVRLLKSKLHLDDPQLYTSKLKSPAQIEKLIGAKRKAEVDALCHKPVKGTNLVSATKTTRPAAKSKVETFMEKVN
jgi:hypothetical protein